jgi:hypothetical protein
MLTNKGLIQLLGMTTPNHPIQDALNQELRHETQYGSKALKEII